MRKDIFISSFGIGGGQAIVLLATPFLARIYSPEEFGIYAAVVAAAGIVATISSLRFDMAIPAVQDDDVKPLFHIALALVFVVSVAATMIIALIIDNFGPILGFSNVPLGWVGGIALLLGATNVCQAQFTRKGRFSWIAALKIVQPVAFAVIALSSALGLNGALAISWLVAFIVGIFACRKVISGGRLYLSIAAARKAWRYPLLSSPMAILDSASLALPLFFIIANFGNENAGNYSQVQRLITAPLVLFGLAAGQVFFKYAGDRYRQGYPVESLLWKVVGYLFFLGIFLIFLAWFVGQPLMVCLLGEGWRTDKYFILLSMLPVVFRMIVSPISSIFLVTNKIFLLGCWQISYFVVTFFALRFASNNSGLLYFLGVFAITEFFMYFIYLGLAIMVARNQKILVAD